MANRWRKNKGQMPRVLGPDACVYVRIRSPRCDSGVREVTNHWLAGNLDWSIDYGAGDVLQWRYSEGTHG